IDGEKSWLWKFSNKKICISHIDKSRGQKVVEDVLGKKYEGAENHSVLTSILQTAKLNNLDPLSVLQDILLPADKNPFARALAPPDKEIPLFIKSRNKRMRMVTSTG
ncbi:MAG: hypothetical protein KKG01_03105, partial [Candidatus Omnitrophica bacterium]|nr:hypothetical protein [Candidatus Omnitrophota bacterium]